MSTRICARLRATLDATGVPWRVEERRRSAVLYVGSVVVGVLPRGHRRDAGCSVDNMLAAVRRVVRSLRDSGDGR